MPISINNLNSFPMSSHEIDSMPILIDSSEKQSLSRQWKRSRKTLIFLGGLVLR